MSAIYLGQILVGMSFLHKTADSVAPNTGPTEAIVAEGSSPAIEPVYSKRACVVGMEVIGVASSDEQLTVIITNDTGCHVIREMPAHVLRQRFSRAPWHYEPAEIIEMIKGTPRNQIHRFGDQGISANKTTRANDPTVKTILDRLVWHLKQCLHHDKMTIDVVHAGDRIIIGIHWQDGASADEVVLHLRNHGIISIFVDNNIDILIDRTLSQPHFDKVLSVVRAQVGNDVSLPTLDEFSSGGSGYPPEVLSLLSDACLKFDLSLAFNTTRPVPPGQTKEP